MKRLVAVAVLLAAASLARAETAAELFKAKCAVCHGPDGKGSTAGKKLGAKDLTTLKASEAELVKDITNGEGKMPAFKNKLTPAQIQELAKFVKSGLK
jgi:cytochrome c6